MKEHVTDIVVRLSETDEFGVVWHGNYVLYFEVARTEMAREFGLTSADLKAAGWFPPVVDIGVQCKLPAKNDDRLSVACRVDPVTSASITIRYRISRGRDTIATGHTTQVLVDARGVLQYQLPPGLDAKIRALAAAYPA